MGRWLPIWLSFVAAVGVAVPGLVPVGDVVAQMPAGDAIEGRSLARQLCADCHGVEPGVRATSARGAPGFQAVADDPAVTALSLEVFLQTPHRTMPNLLLTEAESDHLIAYILSLK